MAELTEVTAANSKPAVVDNSNKFEMGIKVLGNDFLNFSIGVTRATSSWMSTSVIIIVILLLAVWAFGSDIKDVYHWITGSVK